MRLLLLLALMAGPHAQEPAADESSEAAEVEAAEEEEPEGASPPQRPVASEEIVVHDDLEIARRRAALERGIRNLEYQPGKRKGDTVVYRPYSPWKPSVVVHDEGFIIIKRSPVRFAPPTKRQRAVDYLWCIPPFGLMCIRPGGQVVSPAKLNHQKARVAYTVDPDLRDWREAIVSRAWSARVGEEIPTLLDATWQDGAPIKGDAVLETPAQRRAAILDFWSGRACNLEGQEVRDLVALFLEYEIQPSDHPLTASEIAAASEANRCGDQLLIGGMEPAMAPRGAAD